MGCGGTSAQGTPPTTWCSTPKLPGSTGTQEDALGPQRPWQVLRPPAPRVKVQDTSSEKPRASQNPRQAGAQGQWDERAPAPTAAPQARPGSLWGRGQQVVGEGRWEAGGGHCPLADSLLVSRGSALSLHSLLRPRVPEGPPSPPPCCSVPAVLTLPPLACRS